MAEESEWDRDVNFVKNGLDFYLGVYDTMHPMIISEALQQMADEWEEIAAAWDEQDETEEAFQEIVENMGPVDNE